ncbi:MAG: hypothetical protein ACRC2K_13410 [Clostridium sp.]
MFQIVQSVLSAQIIAVSDKADLMNLCIGFVLVALLLKKRYYKK